MVDIKRRAELRAAIELLYFGYRAFTDRPDRILERRGLGRVHHRVLYFVARNPGISIQGLLAILGLQLYVLGATGSINLPYASQMVNLGQLMIIPAAVSYLLALAPGAVILVVELRTRERRRFHPALVHLPRREWGGCRQCPGA